MGFTSRMLWVHHGRTGKKYGKNAVKISPFVSRKDVGTECRELYLEVSRP